MGQPIEPTKSNAAVDLLNRLKVMLHTSAAALVDAFHKRRASAPRPEIEPPAAQNSTPDPSGVDDTAVVRAQGKVVAMVAAVLAGAEVTTVSEFGDLLAVFAVTVRETDPEEGDILSYWASVVHAAADAGRQMDA